MSSSARYGHHGRPDGLSDPRVSNCRINEILGQGLPCRNVAATTAFEAFSAAAERSSYTWTGRMMPCMGQVADLSGRTRLRDALVRLGSLSGSPAAHDARLHQGPAATSRRAADLTAARQVDVRRRPGSPRSPPDPGYTRCEPHPWRAARRWRSAAAGQGLR